MVKILVLIIAGGRWPQYTEYEKKWRRYMSFYPEIEYCFLKMNPGLKEEFSKNEDVLEFKGEEKLSNIWFKTVEGLRYYKDRLGEFDYVLRANLSSFFEWERLNKYLEDKPRENTVIGVEVNNRGHKYPSGCGYTLTIDVALKLIENPIEQIIIDDITLGHFILREGISTIYYNYTNVLDKKNPNDEFEIKWMEFERLEGFHFRTNVSVNHHNISLVFLERLIERAIERKISVEK